VKYPDKKNRRLRRVVLLQAGAGAVLFHAFFVFAFRSIPFSAPKPYVETGPLCALLPPREQARGIMRDLWVWTDLADPTLLSLPNERYGFSRMLNTRPRPPYSGIPGYLPLFFYTPESPVEEPPPLPRWPSLPDQLALSWQPHAAPVPADPDLGALPRGALWRFPDGRIVTDGPTVSPEQIRAATQDLDIQEAHAARIEIIRKINRLRVIVRRTSGSPQLDRLAAAVLIRTGGLILRRIEAGREQHVPSWLPDEDGARTIEFEWRLLAAAPAGPAHGEETQP